MLLGLPVLPVAPWRKSKAIPSSLGQQSHFLVNILRTACTHSAGMILQSIVSTKWVVLKLGAKVTSFQLNIMMMNLHLRVLLSLPSV